VSVRRFFLQPLRDLLDGEARCLARPLDLLTLAAGLALGWFVYVPVHELLHAFGCWATGGEVTRLEIAPLYGGALLARVFPFVVAGGDYAGRLSGFDTGGSDLVYLATDLAPFALVLPGIWAARRAARASWAGRGLAFGAALPFAFAPFLSSTGDAYEIGATLATRLPPWSAPGVRDLLRGDDLLLRAGALADLPAGTDPAPAVLWTGLVLAALVGVAWAFATYALGAWVAARLGQPALREAGEQG
jgi:hypothetical protein